MVEGIHNSEMNTDCKELIYNNTASFFTDEDTGVHKNVPNAMKLPRKASWDGF